MTPIIANFYLLFIIYLFIYLFIFQFECERFEFLNVCLYKHQTLHFFNLEMKNL